MNLKISSAKWQPFCPGGDELKDIGHMYSFDTDGICRVCFNVKMLSYKYSNSNYRDEKSVVFSLYNYDHCTWKDGFCLEKSIRELFR